jgi:hypothetical protein
MDGKCDLTGRKCVDETRNVNGDLIPNHLDTLAERFEEAYAIVRENNKAGRDKQKESYDRGTKLVRFQPRDLVYLIEMTRGKKTCPKFRIRWKGPYEVVRRLSDLNYSITLSRNKEIVVNVNKMKNCFRESFRRPPTAQGKERRETDVTDELTNDEIETLEADGAG